MSLEESCTFSSCFFLFAYLVNRLLVNVVRVTNGRETNLNKVESRQLMTARFVSQKMSLLGLPEAADGELFATSSPHAGGFTQVERSGTWMGRWETQLSIT